MNERSNEWWSEETGRNARDGWFHPLRGFAKHLSMRKMARLAIILTMSGVCWLAVGFLALQLMQLSGH